MGSLRTLPLSGVKGGHGHFAAVWARRSISRAQWRLRRINASGQRDGRSRFIKCSGAHPAANKGVLNMTRAMGIALVLLLSGCSLLDSIPEKVLVDTMCLTAGKRQSLASDPPETIRDAKAWNEQVDRQCGVPAKVASW